MAIKKAQAASKLILKVETGVTASGAAAYSQRTFGDINPEMDTEDAYAVANALASLQTCPLNAVIRQDMAVLTDEG